MNFILFNFNNNLMSPLTSNCHHFTGEEIKLAVVSKVPQLKGLLKDCPQVCPIRVHRRRAMGPTHFHGANPWLSPSETSETALTSRGGSAAAGRVTEERRMLVKDPWSGSRPHLYDPEP